MAERWIIDAMNVIGSRPDGWWHDRPGAMRDLLHRLIADHVTTGRRYTLVVEGRVPDDLTERVAAGVDVVDAGGRGRDVADDRIVSLVADASQPADVTVVTSDKELVTRVRGLGAEVVGAGTFRDELEESSRGRP
ncbi:MAG: NYN domain-containing protein [Actinomycetota bacterium]|nr:NYN domain-containing protein [Actinomycetota bacterium]